MAGARRWGSCSWCRGRRLWWPSGACSSWAEMEDRVGVAAGGAAVAVGGGEGKLASGHRTVACPKDGWGSGCVVFAKRDPRGSMQTTVGLEP